MSRPPTYEDVCGQYERGEIDTPDFLTRSAALWPSEATETPPKALQGTTQLDPLRTPSQGLSEAPTRKLFAMGLVGLFGLIFELVIASEVNVVMLLSFAAIMISGYMVPERRAHAANCECLDCNTARSPKWDY